MVILDHLRPVLAGVASGLLASWWATRLLSAYLYRIDAHEPAVWFAAAFALLVVAVVAAWIPARQASAVEAMAVLKAEERSRRSPVAGDLHRWRPTTACCTVVTRRPTTETDFTGLAEWGAQTAG
jgi:predicted lysophospholipase L1 biosynthesis ABC-type transport system permease subunit